MRMRRKLIACAEISLSWITAWKIDGAAVSVMMIPDAAIAIAIQIP